MAFLAAFNPMKAIFHTILQRTLGKFVEKFSSDDFDIQLSSGTAHFTHLKLKTDLLDDLNAPFELQAGLLESVTLRVPWTLSVVMQLWAGQAVSNIQMDPIQLCIEAVTVTVKPLELEQSGTSSTKSLRRAAKMASTKKVEKLDRQFKEYLTAKLRRWAPEMTDTRAPADPVVVGDPSPWYLNDATSDRLFRFVMKFLRISVSKVHLQFVDMVSDPQRPFRIGCFVSKVEYSGCLEPCCHRQSRHGTVLGVDEDEPATTTESVYTTHNTAECDNVNVYIDSISGNDGNLVIGGPKMDSKPDASAHFVLRNFSARATVSTTVRTHATDCEDKSSTNVVAHTAPLELELAESHFRHLRSLWSYLRYFDRFSRYHSIPKPRLAHQALLSPEQHKALRVWMKFSRLHAIKSKEANNLVPPPTALSAAEMDSPADTNAVHMAGRPEAAAVVDIQQEAVSDSAAPEYRPSSYLTPFEPQLDPYDLLHPVDVSRIRMRARKWWVFARECVLRDLQAARYCNDSSIRCRIRNQYLDIYKRLWPSTWVYLIIPSSSLPPFSIKATGVGEAAEACWVLDVGYAPLPPQLVASNTIRSCQWTAARTSSADYAASLCATTIEAKVAKSELFLWRLQAESELITEYMYQLESQRVNKYITLSSRLDFAASHSVALQCRSSIHFLEQFFQSRLFPLMVYCTRVLWSLRLLRSVQLEMEDSIADLFRRLRDLRASCAIDGIDTLQVLSGIHGKTLTATPIADAKASSVAAVLALFSPTKSRSRNGMHHSSIEEFLLNEPLPADILYDPSTHRRAAAPMHCEAVGFAPCTHPLTVSEATFSRVSNWTGEKAAGIGLERVPISSSHQYREYWMHNHVPRGVDDDFTSAFTLQDRATLHDILSSTPAGLERDHRHASWTNSVNVFVDRIVISLSQQDAVRLIFCLSGVRAQFSALPLGWGRTEGFVQSAHFKQIRPKESATVGTAAVDADVLTVFDITQSADQADFMLSGVSSLAAAAPTGATTSCALEAVPLPFAPSDVDMLHDYDVARHVDEFPFAQETVYLLEVCESCIAFDVESAGIAIDVFLQQICPLVNLIATSASASVISNDTIAATLRLQHSIPQAADDMLDNVRLFVQLREILLAICVEIARYWSVQIRPYALRKFWCSQHASFSYQCCALKRASSCKVTDMRAEATSTTAPNDTCPPLSLIWKINASTSNTSFRTPTSTGENSNANGGPLPVCLQTAINTVAFSGFLAACPEASMHAPMDQLTGVVAALKLLQNGSCPPQVLQSFSPMRLYFAELMPVYGSILLHEVQGHDFQLQLPVGRDVLVSPWAPADSPPSGSSSESNDAGAILSKVAWSMPVSLPGQAMERMLLVCPSEQQCLAWINAVVKASAVGKPTALCSRLGPPNTGRVFFRSGGLHVQIDPRGLQNFMQLWYRTESVFIRSASTRPIWARECGWRPTSYLQDVRDAADSLTSTKVPSTTRPLEILLAKTFSVIDVKFEALVLTIMCSVPILSRPELEVSSAAIITNFTSLQLWKRDSNEVETRIRSFCVDVQQDSVLRLLDVAETSAKACLPRSASILLGDILLDVNEVKSALLLKVLWAWVPAFRAGSIVPATCDTTEKSDWDLRPDLGNRATAALLRPPNRQELEVRLSQNATEMRVHVHSGSFIWLMEGLQLSGRRSTALSDLDEDGGAILVGISNELDEFVARTHMQASILKSLLRFEQTASTATVISVTREVGSALRCEFTSPRRFAAGRITNYCADSEVQVDCGVIEVVVFRDLIEAQRQCVELFSTAASQAQALAISPSSPPCTKVGMPDISPIRAQTPKPPAECAGASQQPATADECRDAFASWHSTPLGRAREINRVNVVSSDLAGAILPLERTTGSLPHEASVHRISSSCIFVVDAITITLRPHDDASECTLSTHISDIYMAYASVPSGAVSVLGHAKTAALVVSRSAHNSEKPRANTPLGHWSGTAGGIVSASVADFAIVRNYGCDPLVSTRFTVRSAKLSAEPSLDGIPQTSRAKWYGTKPWEYGAAANAPFVTNVISIEGVGEAASEEPPGGNMLSQLVFFHSEGSLAYKGARYQREVKSALNEVLVEIYETEDIALREMLQGSNMFVHMKLGGVAITLDPLCVYNCAYAGTCVSTNIGSTNSMEHATNSESISWKHIGVTASYAIVTIRLLGNGMAMYDTPGSAMRGCVLPHTELLTAGFFGGIDLVNDRKFNVRASTLFCGAIHASMYDVSPHRYEIAGIGKNTGLVDFETSEAIFAADLYDRDPATRGALLRSVAVRLRELARSKEGSAVLRDKLRPFRALMMPAGAMWRPPSQRDMHQTTGTATRLELDDSVSSCPSWLISTCSARSILFSPWLLRLLEHPQECSQADARPTDEPAQCSDIASVRTGRNYMSLRREGSLGMMGASRSGAKRRNEYVSAPLVAAPQLWLHMVLPQSNADAASPDVQHVYIDRVLSAAASGQEVPPPTTEGVDLKAAAYMRTFVRNTTFTYCKRWLEEMKTVSLTLKAAVGRGPMWAISYIPRRSAFDYTCTVVSDVKLIVPAHSGIPDHALVVRIGAAIISNVLVQASGNMNLASPDVGGHARRGSRTAHPDRPPKHTDITQRRHPTLDLTLVSELLQRESAPTETLPTKIPIERIVVDLSDVSSALVEPDSDFSPVPAGSQPLFEPNARIKVTDLDMLHLADPSDTALAWVMTACQNPLQVMQLQEALGPFEVVKQSRLLMAPRVLITFDSPIGLAFRLLSPVQVAADVSFPSGVEFAASASNIALVQDILKMSAREPSQFTRLMPEVVGDTGVSTRFSTFSSVRIQYVEKYLEGVVPTLKARLCPDEPGWTDFGSISAPHVPPLIALLASRRMRDSHVVALPDFSFPQFATHPELVDERGMVLARLSKAYNALLADPSVFWEMLPQYCSLLGLNVQELGECIVRAPMTVLDFVFMQASLQSLPKYLRVLLDALAANAEHRSQHAELYSEIQVMCLRMLARCADISITYHDRVRTLEQFVAPHAESHVESSQSQSSNKQADGATLVCTSLTALGDRRESAHGVPTDSVAVPFIFVAVFAVVLPLVLALAVYGVYALHS